MESNFEIGDIVVSRLGHDKDKPFIVVGLDKNGYIAIIDGRYRFLDKPKHKNPKHLIRVARDEEILKKINSPIATNAEIYKMIKVYKDRKE